MRIASYVTIFAFVFGCSATDAPTASPSAQSGGAEDYDGSPGAPGTSSEGQDGQGAPTGHAGQPTGGGGDSAALDDNGDAEGYFRGHTPEAASSAGSAQEGAAGSSKDTSSAANDAGSTLEIVAEGVERVRQAVCAQATSCGCKPSSSSGACVAQYPRIDYAYYAGKNFVYDDGCVPKVIAAIQAYGCKTLSEMKGGMDAAQALGNAGCAIISGVQSGGDACVSDKDCRNGLLCTSDRATAIDSSGLLDIDAALASPKTCQPRIRNQGEACDNYLQACSQGLYCDLRKYRCAPKLALGETCATWPTWSGTCASGLYCDSAGSSGHAATNKCTQTPGEGDACGSVCASGLYCDSGVNKCVRQLGQGAVCMTLDGGVWAGVCASGLACRYHSATSTSVCDQQDASKKYGDPCENTDSGTDMNCPDQACSNGVCSQQPYICVEIL